MKVNSVISISTPYSIRAMKVNNPSPGLPRAVNNPPTAPTYVAPTFFTKSPLSAKSTASRAINIKLIGKGKNMFPTNMIEPNSEIMKRRFSLCVYGFSFYYYYRFVVCIKKPCIYLKAHVFSCSFIS